MVDSAPWRAKHTRHVRCPICIAMDTRHARMEYAHQLRSAPEDEWMDCGFHNHLVVQHWGFVCWLSTMPACIVCGKVVSSKMRDDPESDCHMIHTHIMRLREANQVRHIKHLYPMFLLIGEERPRCLAK